MSNTLSLLPCPFCGAESEIENNFAKTWWVQCHGDQHTDGMLYESAAEAAAAWNRRTQQPVVREPLTPSQYNIALGCATDIPPSRYEAVTRAIERAHGIKGGQHG